LKGGTRGQARKGGGGVNGTEREDDYRNSKKKGPKETEKRCKRRVGRRPWSIVSRCEGLRWKKHAHSGGETGKKVKGRLCYDFKILIRGKSSGRIPSPKLEWRGKRVRRKRWGYLGNYKENSGVWSGGGRN